MGSSMIWKRFQGLKTVMMMVMVQISNAAVNIFYKLASNDGMNLSILIAYRMLFASALVVPLALVIERKERPKLTRMILFHAFLAALLGSTLAQNMNAKALVLTSPTFASAFANLIPTLTFIIAVFFRVERVGLGTMAGKAKVIGTLTGMGGAMLLTFYKGREINIWSATHFNLLDGNHNKQPSLHQSSTNDQVFGSILALGFCITNALSFIFQAKVSASYPCPYSSTALISVMGCVQSVVFALYTERKWSAWSLIHRNIRLVTVLFAGVVSSGLMVTFIMICVNIRGPLFVSIFYPLSLILVAVAGSLVLDEKLHVGCIIGSVIIVAGLYMVIWGKSEEKKRNSKLMPSGNSEDERDHENGKDNTNNAAINMHGVGDIAAGYLATIDETHDEVQVKNGAENQDELDVIEQGGGGEAGNKAISLVHLKL